MLNFALITIAIIMFLVDSSSKKFSLTEQNKCASNTKLK